MKKFVISIAAMFSLLVLQQSCTKLDTTTLGSDLIPAVDNVNTFDTLLDVYTNNFFYPDSTKVGLAAAHALGIVEDPVFGTTSADIYFNLYPNRFGSLPFPRLDSLADNSIDSVVLSLAYTQIYGDTNSIQNFKVYEMAQSQAFYDTLNYPINTPDFNLAAQLGAVNGYAFNRFDDVDSLEYPKSKKTAISNVLRIPLNKSFGNRLVGYDTTNAYKDSAAFASYFKGFAIKSDNGSAIKKALAYFNLTGSETRLIFYYRVIKNGSTPTIDTTSSSFAISALTNAGFTKYAPTANLVKRNIAGSAYANNINNAAANKSELYIQSSPGSYATLYIPGLANLSNRTIHRADIIFQRQNVPGNDQLGVPRALYIDAIDTVPNTTPQKIKYLVIPNDLQQSDNALGYNIEDLGGFMSSNGKYTFNLSRYVQGIVTKKQRSYTLRIYAPFNTFSSFSESSDFLIPFSIATPVAAGRVVLNGGAHATNKVRMRIIYSKI